MRILSALLALVLSAAPVAAQSGMPTDRPWVFVSQWWAEQVGRNWQGGVTIVYEMPPSRRGTWTKLRPVSKCGAETGWTEHLPASDTDGGRHITDARFVADCTFATAVDDASGTRLLSSEVTISYAPVIEAAKKEARKKKRGS